MPVELKPFSWDRMIAAVQAVKERTLRAARALEAADIPYAIAGGNAVAAWVARVDIAAVRNTADVDILVRREDFERIKIALEAVGFEYHHVSGVDCFIDGPDGRPRDAVHLLYAGEKVKPEYDSPSATVDQAVSADHFQIVDLEPLVRMKLNSFRRKDTMHLMDFIELGIIDLTWPSRFSPPLAARLQELLDDPIG